VPAFCGIVALPVLRVFGVGPLSDARAASGLLLEPLIKPYGVCRAKKGLRKIFSAFLRAGALRRLPKGFPVDKKAACWYNKENPTVKCFLSRKS